MAAADMAVWRRQNSDAVTVELVLTDGSRVKGVLLLSRDKTLREFMNIGTEAFFELDCDHDGPIVIAKASVRQICSKAARKDDDKAKIEALATRRADLEKADAYKTLGVSPGADHETMRKAYFAKARLYHPDRFADHELPSEIADYLNAMARRLNTAYDELDEQMKAAAAKPEPAPAPPSAPPPAARHVRKTI